MRVSVRSNITEVIGWTARLHPQYRFALAKALSDTAIEAWRALPAEAERSFAGGATPYTERGFEFSRASKDRLEASVAVRPNQAQYLRYQVEGGRRSPRRVALRLPSVVQLDPYGNLPAGLIRQLIARAQAGKRATRTQSRRFKVSQQVDLFYGQPDDGRPAGIYKRVVLGPSKHRLVPIIVFPRRDANYTERPFDFYGFVDRVVRRRFDANLDAAWSHALSTAR